RTPGAGASISTPIAEKMAAVARVSSPSRNPSMREVPSASADSMIARWEMDLSPGMASSPRRGWPGWASQVAASAAPTSRPGIAGIQGGEEAAVLDGVADADAQALRQAVAAHRARHHVPVKQTGFDRVGSGDVAEIHQQEVGLRR